MDPSLRSCDAKSDVFLPDGEFISPTRDVTSATGCIEPVLGRSSRRDRQTVDSEAPPVGKHQRVDPRAQHTLRNLPVSLGWAPALRWALISLFAVVGTVVAYDRGVSARQADARVPAAASDPSAAARYDGVPGSLFDTPTGAAAVAATGGKAPGATPTKAAGLPANTAPVASALAADGIPAVALQAYQQAADRQARLDPACGLPWELLAAIGRVESNHGRFAGAVLHSDGVSTPRIIGIPLDGNGTAAIRDTDGGRLDGDTVYDRAVGPMQFIPSTWATWSVDANGDGVADPFNLFDEAAAAAGYLCRAGGDLASVDGRVRAVGAYNHSTEYVRLVLQIESVYTDGTPGESYPVPPTVAQGAPPPANPGRPPAVHPDPDPRPTSSRPPSSSSAATSSGGAGSPTDTPPGSPTDAPGTSPTATTPPPVQSTASTDPPPTTSAPADSSTPPNPPASSSSDAAPATVASDSPSPSPS
jgi:membrane-bound lytic murein transglycosylase B